MVSGCSASANGPRDRRPGSGATSCSQLWQASGLSTSPRSSPVPTPHSFLAQYGADVIKIESPTGDRIRAAGPGAEEGMAALYLGFNANKRSVVLNLKRTAGVTALLRLVGGADVLLHNMHPQKMERLGLDAQQVRARNLRLVFVRLHRFGRGGAYADQPAYKTTPSRDCPGRPTSCTAPSASLATRLRSWPTRCLDSFAAHAILAALLQRETTGRDRPLRSRCSKPRPRSSWPSTFTLGTIARPRPRSRGCRERKWGMRGRSRPDVDPSPPATDTSAWFLQDVEW